ncbi:16S rRNA processing protein RimM [Terribacillus halophilus]|uniref:Ribosome maturation factor RimM n=1 Tax=Terribacillus halophilus TaxID=361279 RepID=A0A1G6N7Q4_9BACI|nr:ribosome maturation factor RimM [Terribacillus halophilus]SDC63849.1 16S rRNA processing protein RimM [Terribacillus halophilus]
MEMKMFNVGKVVNTHGVAGEVRVVRITDFDERFEPGEELYWFQDENSKPQKLIVKTHRKHKTFDLLTFQGYTSINQVEAFKGGILKVREDQLGDLEENEFYYHEIIGCTVETVDGETLGKVKEILSPGANDVWVVQRPKQKDLLVPYIEPVVKQIDVDSKRIVIEPMEGLLDL